MPNHYIINPITTLLEPDVEHPTYVSLWLESERQQIFFPFFFLYYCFFKGTILLCMFLLQMLSVHQEQQLCPTAKWWLCNILTELFLTLLSLELVFNPKAWLHFYHCCQNLHRKKFRYHAELKNNNCTLIENLTDCKRFREYLDFIAAPAVFSLALGMCRSPHMKFSFFEGLTWTKCP